MAGTRWVRLDTQYLDNPKIRRLPPLARLLHIGYITYCAAELTDGFVAREVRAVVYARCSLGRRSAHTARRALLDAGLIHEVTENGIDGDRVHDFLAMNPQLERSVVEREREANRERQRRWREKHITP